MIKPRTAPGVLELLPLDQIAFQGMLDTIRRSYERFGFLPVETPVMELSEVLLTKTGGETERQVYFLQSTGALQAAEAGAMPELAMRFDLTVPLARYVAEHEHDLSFPFRRYQIQRVYRGERAQRGRFREFYQADIDIIGKDSLDIRFDAELPAVIDSVFSQLAVGPFTIWLNNRKIMRGFLEGLGIEDGERQGLVLREVDKLDKRGPAAVRETLCSEAFGLDGAAADRLLAFVQVRSRGHADALSKLDALGHGSETFNQGVAELRTVIALLHDFGVAESHYAINLSIARGLDYYTGTVFETTLNDYPQIGSVCSGGRYENLAGHYSKSKLPGVGISIGVTRLYWQLREAGLIDTATSSVEVMISMLDESRLPRYLELAGLLRAAGINTEVQLEARKLGKQLQHADRAGIRFVVMLGEDEDARGVVSVKDMRKQEQFEVSRGELARTLRVEIEQARAMAARESGARERGTRGTETH